MRVYYNCPDCRTEAVADALEARDQFGCPDCPRKFPIPAGAKAGTLSACLVCGQPFLYVRKAFPQKLGVAFVVIAALISSVFYAYERVDLTFAVLGGCVAVELIFYAVLGWAVVCYNCGAEHRGFVRDSRLEVFDMHTAERFRR